METLTPKDKLMKRVAVDGETGCWIYTGTINKHGYGALGVGGKSVRAHRLSYQVHVGEIPLGLELDHTCHTRENCPGGNGCRHRRCVNPKHLEPVTKTVNVRRGHLFAAEVTSHAANFQKAKTHCPQGHEYTPDNVKIIRKSLRWPTGMRRCRVCDRKYRKASKAARRQRNKTTC